MIDANILLQGRVANSGDAVGQGINNANAIMQSPLIRQSMQQQIDAQEIQNGQAPLREELLRGQITGQQQNIAAQQQAMQIAQRNQELKDNAVKSLQGLQFVQNNDYAGLKSMVEQQLQGESDPAEQQAGARLLEMVRRASAGDSMAGQQIQKVLQSQVELAQSQGLLSIPQQADNKGRFKLDSSTGSVIDSATGRVSINPNVVAQIQANAQKLAEKPELKASDIRGINSDIRTITKDAKQIAQSAEDLESLRKVNSGAAQLATIFKFMKALDPTSVVREGEQDQLARTGGIFDYFSNVIEGIRSGQKLTGTQLDDIVQTGKTLANNAISSSNQEIDGYLETFEDSLTGRQRKNFGQFKLDLFDIDPTPEQQGQFQIGQIYEDANGNRAKYAGDGNWEEL